MSERSVPRPIPITCLAIVVHACAVGIVALIITDLTVLAVPSSLIVVLCLAAVFQVTLGIGLWKLRKWARLTAVIVSVFLAFPCIVEILTSFRSLDIAKLVANLFVLTLLGMIVAYLIHPETRQAFEEPRTELHLK